MEEHYINFLNHKNNDNKKYPNKATKDFYSLPLTEDQRKELYEEIMRIYYEEGPDAFKAEKEPPTDINENVKKN